MAKRGRPSKSGKRKPCGRLKARASAVDYGNVKVQELHSRYRAFQGGKADQWVQTPIGRAWAVGLLDGYEVDSSAIRDAGLDYGERYWGHYPSASAVANYEGEDRRGGGGGDYCDPDPRGERFQALDEAVSHAGSKARSVMHELCVDYYWFPEHNPMWLDRLLNEQLAKRDRSVGGYLQRLDGGDLAKLQLAIEALLMIAAGRQRKVA